MNRTRLRDFFIRDEDCIVWPVWLKYEEIITSVKKILGQKHILCIWMCALSIITSIAAKHQECSCHTKVCPEDWCHTGLPPMLAGTQYNTIAPPDLPVTHKAPWRMRGSSYPTLSARTSKIVIATPRSTPVIGTIGHQQSPGKLHPLTRDSGQGQPTCNTVLVVAVRPTGSCSQDIWEGTSEHLFR